MGSDNEKRNEEVSSAVVDFSVHLKNALEKKNEEGDSPSQESHTQRSSKDRRKS